LKLPFKLITSNANWLFDMRLFREEDLYSRLYYLYLEKAGWQEEEYNQALLQSIDANWEPEKN